jgi:hypothetical protein
MQNKTRNYCMFAAPFKNIVKSAVLRLRLKEKGEADGRKSIGNEFQGGMLW